MNDTESSEVRNEQELNLFDDQPLPEEDVSAAAATLPQTESADFNLVAQDPESVADQVYVAGAKLVPAGQDKAGESEMLVTNGGRVLGCTAVADTLEDAIRDAYAVAAQVHFENAYCRSDIGQRALKAAAQ